MAETGSAPLPPTHRPPQEAFIDESIRGTRCQDRTEVHGVVPAQHDGCPGWWAGFDGDEEIGFVCTCSCHESFAGWPGWVAHQRRI